MHIMNNIKGNSQVINEGKTWKDGKKSGFDKKNISRPKPKKTWDCDDVDQSRNYRIKHMCESELKSFIFECVKGVLNEIGDTVAGQKALGALAARQDNKYQRLSNKAYPGENGEGPDSKFYIPADNMYKKQMQTVDFANDAAGAEIAKGGVDSQYPEAFNKGYEEYKKSHKPEDEHLRPSDLR